MSSVLQIYRSFGLGSSYATVMKFGCLLQYSEYGAVDRDFPDVPAHLLEDIYQVQIHDAAHTCCADEMDSIKDIDQEYMSQIDMSRTYVCICCKLFFSMCHLRLTSVAIMK